MSLGCSTSRLTISCLKEFAPSNPFTLSDELQSYSESCLTSLYLVRNISDAPCLHRHQRFRYQETQRRWHSYRWCELTSPLRTHTSHLTHCRPQLVYATHPKFLNDIKGLSEIKVGKIKEAAKKCLVCYITLQLYQHFVLDNFDFSNTGKQYGDGKSEWVTGNQRLEERKKCMRLSTGSSAFDGMLGGWVMAMSFVFLLRY